MGRMLWVLIWLVACGQLETPQLAETEQEMAVCADGSTIYGIDVSRFQGSIDWQKVKDSGVVYAYIQISRSVTDLDAKFEYNWRRAKEVGILRGAYQRFQPDQDVALQAQIFLDKLGPYQEGDLPPMLDVEDDGGLTGTQIANRVTQWMDRVEPVVGVTPLIYTGFYFWRDEVASADFSEYPLWIANYGTDCPLVPEKWTTWTIHQYSSTATIPGITANTVDVNKFNGTLAELQALAQPPECGDGSCNGEESADSCTMDCAPCQVIDDTDAGRIVDDAGECFTAGGNPMYVRTENAGFGSSLQWTHATDAAAPSNFGRWDLHFAVAGRYRVEAFTPAPFGMSKQAVYQVLHGAETTSVALDQSAVDGWNVIGELDFVAGGHGQYVRVNDNTGEPNASDTKIVFDALRFTLLSEAPDDPTAPEDPGCSTGRGQGGILVLLVALVALGAGRRRR